MFFELIATFAAGLGAAGIVMLANRLGGGRLPRWLMPVAAGAAMLGYTVWSEYSWADRTAANLPEGISVVREVEETIAWKPWTFLAPQVTRLIAVDSRSVRRKPDAPEIVLVNLYLFGRWRPPAEVPQLIDCAAPARADATTRSLDNPAEDAAWVPLERDDGLVQALCEI